MLKYVWPLLKKEVLQQIQEDDRVFPLEYTRAREIVKTAGNKIGG